MTFKLDLKDKKILYELDLNCRKSSSQIAKKVGLSKEAVNYRIKRFEKENIITHYQLIINLAKLNIYQFKLCLSLQHLKEEEIQSIIKKLKQKEYVKWIVSCHGNWDILVAIETINFERINYIKDEVLELFKNNIREKSLSILVEAETYARSYFVDENSFRESRIIMKTSSNEKIEELDLLILKELSVNARKSLVEIAQKLKTTPRIINYRMSQMEKNKVILGYKIAINYEKLKIKFYKLFIYLSNIQVAKIKQLKNYLTNNKNIIHNVTVLGNWDLEPEIEVHSEKEFQKIITNLKDEFSDIIQKIDVITISKEHKFVYF